MVQKLFKIQVILFVSYLLLTIFFLIGFHNSMYDTFLPTWLGDIMMLLAAVYFVGGGILVPVVWVIMVVYQYQMKDIMEKEAFSHPVKDFLFKQFFPLMVLCFYLINLGYLVILKKESSLDFVHFLAVILLIFSLYVQDQSPNKRKWTALFGLGCGGIVVWMVELVVSPYFKQAMLEQTELIYGMSYQMMFYLIWIFTIAVIGYATVGFFYIPSQKKYRHLLLLIVSLMIVFLNIVRQIDFFSQLMIG